MSMMRVVALVMTVMETISHHDTMHVKVRRLVQGRMLTGRPISPEMRRLAIHSDGRKRLNRKAQCQQHDEEEFAPVRHGSKSSTLVCENCEAVSARNYAPSGNHAIARNIAVLPGIKVSTTAIASRSAARKKQTCAVPGCMFSATQRTESGRRPGQKWRDGQHG
jgi:hypothetical protein